MRRNIRALATVLKFATPLAAAVLLLAPSDGFAQYGKMFPMSPRLTGEDVAIIRKAVREELSGKPNGTTLPWSNPKSQNSGTVTLLDSFPSHGRDCRRVRYMFNRAPSEPPSVKPATYVLTSCRFMDGTWKLDSEARRDTSG